MEKDILDWPPAVVLSHSPVLPFIWIALIALSYRCSMARTWVALLCTSAWWPIRLHAIPCKILIFLNLWRHGANSVDVEGAFHPRFWGWRSIHWWFLRLFLILQGLLNPFLAFLYSFAPSSSYHFFFKSLLSSQMSRTFMIHRRRKVYNFWGAKV